MNSSFHPGKVWLDNHGDRIQAHGGSVLFHQGKYYWYGENKEKKPLVSRKFGIGACAAIPQRTFTIGIVRGLSSRLIYPILIHRYTQNR